MKISLIYNIYIIMKPIIEFLKNRFTIIVVTSFVTATISLWHIPGRDISWGWIFAFLMLFAGLGYSIISQFRKKK